MTTVLIVDADPVDRNVITRSLTGAGYGVLEAASGVEAMQVLKGQEQIHVAVIADACLLGTATEIAAIRTTLPILVASAEIGTQDVSASLPATVRILPERKPIAPLALLEALENVLNQG